jgi:hypothetical protein
MLLPRGTLNSKDAGDYQSIRFSSLILERKAKRIVAIPWISSVLGMDQSARRPAIVLTTTIEKVLSMEVVERTVARLSEGIYVFMFDI